MLDDRASATSTSHTQATTDSKPDVTFEDFTLEDLQKLAELAGVPADLHPKYIPWYKRYMQRGIGLTNLPETRRILWGLVSPNSQWNPAESEVQMALKTYRNHTCQWVIADRRGYC